MPRVLIGVKDNCICENGVLNSVLLFTITLEENKDLYCGVIAELYLSWLSCLLPLKVLLEVYKQQTNTSSLFRQSDAFNSVHSAYVSCCNLM